jgi:hypothetical protein
MTAYVGSTSNNRTAKFARLGYLFGHGEHPVRSIPMQKERLAEEREHPMSDEENANSPGFAL